MNIDDYKSSEINQTIYNATYLANSSHPHNKNNRQHQMDWELEIKNDMSKYFNTTLPPYKILYKKTFTDGFTIVAIMGMLYGLWMCREENS